MAPTATTTTKKAPRKRASAKRRTAAANARTEQAKTPVEAAQEYAERAVLIPVGAALVARDRVVESVEELLDTYSTPAKAGTQIKKFERRGATARNRLERRARKTRTRVERELRTRRNRVERTFKRQRNVAAKTVSKQVDQVQTQVEQALQNGGGAATRVQDRVLS